MGREYGADGFRVQLRCFSGERVDRHVDTEQSAVKLAMALLHSHSNADSVTVWEDASNQKVFCHGFAKLFFDKRRFPEALD